MSDTFNPTPFFQNDRAEAFYKDLRRLRDAYPDCYIEAWTPRDFFPLPVDENNPVDVLDLAPSSFVRNCQVVNNLERMHSADIGVNWEVVRNAVAELPEEETDDVAYNLKPPARIQVLVVCVHHKHGQDFIDMATSQEEVLRVQAGWCADYIDELPEEHREAARQFAEAGNDAALVELYTAHHPCSEYFEVYEGAV